MNQFKPSSERGMTLIEIAIAMAIVGVMLGAALELYNQNKDAWAQKVTRERMNYIVRALANYAETNNRIPCPADPSIVTARVATTPPVGREPWRFGFEWNATQPSPTSKPSIGSCSALAQQRGLVPYQTLGIPFEYAKDGWGNYFTYGVSPVFTQQTDYGNSGATTNDTNDTVHERCRAPGWIANNSPINAPKARFCCAKDSGALYAPATDLTIINKDSSTTVSPTRDAIGANYAALNVQLSTESPTNVVKFRAGTGNIEAAAFVLVSHGPNGNCAFLANDTANQKICTTGRETSNADANQSYYIGRPGATGANLYDDIVVWMTQFGLMAYNGGSSCNLP